jgi:hypothetical protein
MCAQAAQPQLPGKADSLRPTPFNSLEVENHVQLLSAGAADSFRRWWAASAAASANLSGRGMLCAEFVAQLVAWAHYREVDASGEPDGAILVFLPGVEDITEVQSELHHCMMEGSAPCNIVVLHGAMEFVDQRQVFARAPRGTRKIVLATNVAETSITIEDVTVVVDAGLHKLMSYDAVNKMRHLTPNWYALPCAMSERVGTPSGCC